MFCLNLSFSQDEDIISKRRESKGFFVGGAIVNNANISIEELTVKHVGYTGSVKEFEQNTQSVDLALGINLDLGYQFNPYISSGVYGRGKILFDDSEYTSSYGYNAGAFVGLSMNKYIH